MEPSRIFKSTDYETGFVVLGGFPAACRDTVEIVAPQMEIIQLKEAKPNGAHFL